MVDGGAFVLSHPSRESRSTVPAYLTLTRRTVASVL